MRGGHKAGSGIGRQAFGGAKREPNLLYVIGTDRCGILAAQYCSKTSRVTAEMPRAPTVPDRNGGSWVLGSKTSSDGTVHDPDDRTHKPPAPPPLISPQTIPEPVPQRPWPIPR